MPTPPESSRSADRPPIPGADRPATQALPEDSERPPSVAGPLASAAPVDLSTCDREPIHIPGAIQPQGVLLAFDPAGRLLVRSENAAALGALPESDAPLDPRHLTEEARAAISAALADPALVPEAVQLELSGRVHDFVFHRYGGVLIAEIEARAADAPPLDGFALRAQRAILRIQGVGSLDTLLQAVANEVRALTGFDRVMVYRFQPDGSGLVDAEARREDLEPFLGMRYPASDIPAQARRLYILNPLRLIADVGYRAVPLVPPINPLTGAPLDLSHAVLRSVSPIHVEYLMNMGVRASMSISIVIGGRLWGLIACHHMAPRLVPHAIRMACHLLAQVVSVLVERTETAHAVASLERSLTAQMALLQRVNEGHALLPSLSTGSPTVADLVACEGVAVLLAGAVSSVGRVPSPEGLAAIVAWLQRQGAAEVFSTFHPAADCPELSPSLDGLCGMLAIRFFGGQGGYVLWFRAEERETVRWGGNPSKQYQIGPLGPRLTPRGSFEEWRETVLGRSRPWSAPELAAAERLQRELQEIALSKARARILALEESNSELDRLAYVVSHDIRAPLRAISTLSEFIKEDLRAGKIEEVYEHCEHLRTRVLRLDALTAAILSYSRSGHQKERPRTVDVELLARSSIDLLAPPASVRVVIHPGLPTLTTHEALLQQVFMNLISNALKYGTRDGAGTIELGGVDQGASWELWVRDHGAGIAPEHHERVFKLFCRISSDNSGTGVGLAIVRRIVETHGGRVWVDSTPGAGATFRFLWPKDTLDVASAGPASR